jgi:hypothetical protein
LQGKIAQPYKNLSATPRGCPFSAFSQTKISTAASKIMSTLASATSTEAAAEVLAFERAMEAAVVRGDVAYVDRVSAPDLTFTHGDGWTTGGKALGVDESEVFSEAGRKQAVQRARPRLRQSRNAWRHRYYLWALCGAEQNR